MGRTKRRRRKRGKLLPRPPRWSCCRPCLLDQSEGHVTLIFSSFFMGAREITLTHLPNTTLLYSMYVCVCAFYSPPAGVYVNKRFFFSSEGETSIEMRKHNLHRPLTLWRSGANSSWPEKRRARRSSANVWHFYEPLLFLFSQTYCVYITPLVTPFQKQDF